MSGRIYDSRHWRRFREQILRERPLCEDCEALGLAVRGSDCDHRVALKDGGAAYDPANIAVRCHACHSVKTAHQDGGFGNKRKGHTPIKGAGADGWPLDPNHWWHK